MTTIDLQTTRRMAFGRRGFLAGASALAALVGRDADAAGGPKAPRRPELTIGLASAYTIPTPVPALTTFELSVELESPAEAFRIGVANITPAPYTLGGMACCEAGPGTPWQAQPGSPWKVVPFGRGAEGAHAVTVPGNQVAPTGARNVPVILWSEWVPYRTTAAGRPQMLFRTLVPPQTLPLHGVGWPPRPQEKLPGFPPRLRLGRELPGDFVTDPGLQLSAGKGAGFVPIYVIQYRSTAPGVQIVVGGDSHPAQWDNFAQLAASQLSTPELPITVWNTAWGAQPSRTFWPLLQMAIEQSRASVSVIEGWTANDGMKDPAVWDRYVLEIRQSIDLTRRLGGVPIVFTGMPRKLFGTPIEPQWRHYNEELPRRLPGTLIFNLDPIVEDPEHPGDWRPGFSDDRIHPSLQANAAMAPAFGQLLRSLL